MPCLNLARIGKAPVGGKSTERSWARDCLFIGRLELQASVAPNPFRIVCTFESRCSNRRFAAYFDTNSPLVLGQTDEKLVVTVLSVFRDSSLNG